MRGPAARSFAFVLLGAAAVRAQPAVQVANCPEELASRLPAVVKLEIDVLLRERGPTRAPPESIAVRCEEDAARIEVTLEGYSRRSTIDLHALATEHRARAVGLAAAELVHAMSSRAPTPEPPPAAPLAPPAPSAPPQPERPAPSSSPRAPARPTLLLGGLGEGVGKPTALLFGARLSLLYPLGAMVVPAISIDGAMGGTTARSARITSRTATAAAHLYFGTTTGSVRWDAGPGGRLGWMHLAGTPDAGTRLEGDTLSAPWGGPEVSARVAYAASSRRSPLFALEVGAGIVTLPIRGVLRFLDQSERIYTVQGPWLSVCAEVGIGL
jgi:hypothetical protein